MEIHESDRLIAFILHPSHEHASVHPSPIDEFIPEHGIDFILKLSIRHIIAVEDHKQGLRL
jgi:hypothetical protein